MGMTDVQNPELKPCPLCGRAVEWKSGAIACSCGLKFRRGDYELTNKYWNRRTAKKSKNPCCLKININHMGMLSTQIRPGSADAQSAGGKSKGSKQGFVNTADRR